jgi:hypothetical protein
VVVTSFQDIPPLSSTYFLVAGSKLALGVKDVVLLSSSTFALVAREDKSWSAVAPLSIVASLSDAVELYDILALLLVILLACVDVIQVLAVFASIADLLIPESFISFPVVQL